MEWDGFSVLTHFVVKPLSGHTQALFPDNAYAVDSGGDPLDIPNLSFEQFRAFHQAYYHPTNARVSESRRVDGWDGMGAADQQKELYDTIHSCLNERCTPQIYFYGNDDPLARLDLLDSYLDEFEAIKVDSAVTYQPKKTEPWTLTQSFPATEVMRANAVKVVDVLRLIAYRSSFRSQPTR